MVPTSRQTLSYLRGLFEERGIHPKNKLGQNFLIDLNLIDLVVRSSEVGPGDVVIEVGSGTGSLTMRLIELADALVSVEIDPAFANLTAELVGTHYHLYGNGRKPAGVSQENCKLIHADALENKNKLNPDILSDLRALLAKPGMERVKLIANLPFAVAVPVIANLLLTDLPIERMVVMVQWEIAERLTAVPSTKDYASLAVLVQSIADVTLVRKVMPTVFWPRPKVESAIVMIRPNAAKRGKVGDVQTFRNFLRDLYSQRRKSLRAVLAGFPSRHIPKPEVDARLAELGIAGSVRAEALDVEQHLRLCQTFGGGEV